MKKFFWLFLVCFLLLSLEVGATTTNYTLYDSLSPSIQENISKEEFCNLPYALQMSVANYGINQTDTLSEKSSAGYISGYSSFNTYVDMNFSQGGNSSTSSTTCVPISCANVLSYFKYRGYSNLFNTSFITQSDFNQICSDVGWTNSNASTLAKACTGLNTYAKRKGYTITNYSLLTSNWTGLKNYINNNTPLIVSELSSTPGKKGHAYTVLGYRTTNGSNEIYVQTGISLIPYTWISWSLISQAKAFVIN